MSKARIGLLVVSVKVLSPFYLILYRPQLDCKAASGGFGDITQSAAVGGEDGAGDVQAQTDVFGAGLERTEKFLGVGHAGAGIAEGNGDEVTLDGRGNADFARVGAFQRLNAVAHQVDEDL